MTRCRPLLLVIAGLFAVACSEDDGPTVTEQPEGTSAADTDEPDDSGVGTSSTSGGEDDDTDDPADSDGWDPPEFDLGGGEWEPAYACDDPNAIIPEGVVECQDAIPGSEAPMEAQLAVKEAFGEDCGLERMCSEQWGVDCYAAANGPYHYVAAETLEVIATCGGACQVGPCADCPPEIWSCPIF